MLRLVAITLIALGGCAAPRVQSQTGEARLSLGAPVEAPAGALDYCRRAPDECGVLTVGLRGRLAPTGGAVETVGSSRSLFHALMLQRAAAAREAVFSERVEVELTQARAGELFRINRSINRSIRATTDNALYGAEEYWVRPLQISARGARGDCEDYALEKRAALIAAGWPVEALAMTVAISPRVGLHAVLLVQTDRGDFVLDNLYDRPMPIAALDYVWVSRQASASLGEWTSARLVGAPAPRAPSLPQEASERFHAMLNARARRENAVQSRRELEQSANLGDEAAANPQSRKHSLPSLPLRLKKPTVIALRQAAHDELTS